MYYFSETFLAGLQTKSERFQQKFFEIVDALCAYFDTEEERADFQKYIQENHFYDKPGNILASMQKQFGGKPDNEELKKKIHQFLLGLFDDCSMAEAMEQVPHIIVCVSAPEDAFSDEDIAFLRELLSFERICRGCPKVSVTTIVNDTSHDRGISCLVIALK